MKISKSNYFLTIVTTSLVLFFLGLFLMVFIQGRNFVDKLKEHANIVLELEDELDESQKTQISRTLENHQAVISGSLKFISKEEALHSLKESLELQFVEQGSENPLNDMFQFNLKREFLDKTSLSSFKNEWMELKGVTAVVYQIEFYDDVSATLKSISWVMFIIMLLFLLISIILIHNTFYFRLNADRIKIKTMELVGADWSFIKRPYLKEAGRVAFYSWLISAGIILLMFLIILLAIPEILEYLNLVSILLVLLILGAASYIICRISASLLINKYLKEQIHNIQ